jgi:hypothetical protein
MAIDATMYLLGCMMIEQQQQLQRDLDRQEREQAGLAKEAETLGQIVGEGFEPQESVPDATGDSSR